MTGTERKRGHGVALLLAAALFAGGCSQSPQQLYERAQQSIERNDLRRAEIDLKRLLQTDATHAPGRLALGDVLLKQGHPEAALRELGLAREYGTPEEHVMPLRVRALVQMRQFDAALAEARPELLDLEQRKVLHTLRGDALLGLARTQEALSAYEQSLQIDAEYVFARLGAARARYRLEGFDAAKVEIDRAMSSGQAESAVRFAWGALCLEDGRFREAAAAFEQASSAAARQTAPQDAFAALVGLVEARLALGDQAGSNAALEQLASAAPGHPTTLYLRARAQFLQGRNDAARRDLERLIADDPANARAKLLLGAVNYAQNNLGQAEMYLSNVVVADPGNTFARLLLSDTRTRQQKHGAAMDALSPAIQAGDRTALAYAAQLSLRAGDVSGGIAYLEENVARTGNDPDALLQLAAGYLVAGRGAAAVELLQRLPMQGAMAERRDLLLLGAHLRSGDSAAARRLASAIGAEHSSDAATQSLVGGVLLAAGDPEAALPFLVHAQQLAPRDARARLNLAWAELRRGRSAEADAHAQAAAELGARDATVLVSLGGYASARGDSAGAVRWLERACATDDAAVEPRILLAQQHLLGRDFERAAQAANEAIRLQPNNPAALNALGVALSGRGLFSASIDSFRRASDSVPGSPALRLNLAQAYLRAGQSREALQMARDALQLDGEFIPALALIGELSLAAGDHDQVRKVIARLRELDANHPGAALLEGDLERARKNYVAAARAYAAGARTQGSGAFAIREYVARRTGDLDDPTGPLKRHLTAQPDDVEVRFVLAQAQADTGDSAAAIASYRRILDSQPRHVATLNNLAWLLHERGDPQALELARQAREIDEKSASVADTYGWILLSRGRVPEALPLLQQAVDLAPGDPLIAYHLAIALARSGQREQAMERLASIVDADTPFEQRDEARRLLEELSNRTI